MQNDTRLHIQYVPAAGLKPAEYNPREHDKAAADQLKESIRRFGNVDPLIVNRAAGRENVVIGGHFRLEILKELGRKEVPVVFVDIPDIEREKELNIRLNKNTGWFSSELLAEFDEKFLAGIGFDSEELDKIFETDDISEIFDLNRELEKLDIHSIDIKKGDVFDLNGSRAMCGDSTVEADMSKLMGGEKADMCLTDPPYLLDYLRGKKRNGKATEGFGLKRDRRYLETESLPDNFTELWMANVAKVQKPDFSIMVFENPKNLRTIWNAMERHWRYRNTITWHLPNRVQGFSAKYRFFNKADIALLGTRGSVSPNIDPESEELLQNEYENALFMTSGSPHWEPYEKGKKYCPTDFATFKAADEKSSGQGIIFGTKPIELLLPYMKVLTKRGDLVLEPFCGSGSTMVTAAKLNRRCFMMEKSPVYLTVALRRWEKFSGLKAVKTD